MSLLEKILEAQQLLDVYLQSESQTNGVLALPQSDANGKRNPSFTKKEAAAQAFRALRTQILKTRMEILNDERVSVLNEIQNLNTSLQTIHKALTSYKTLLTRYSHLLTTLQTENKTVSDPRHKNAQLLVAIRQKEQFTPPTNWSDWKDLDVLEEPDLGGPPGRSEKETPKSALKTEANTEPTALINATTTPQTSHPLPPTTPDKYPDIALGSDIPTMGDNIDLTLPIPSEDAPLAAVAALTAADPLNPLSFFSSPSLTQAETQPQDTTLQQTQDQPVEDMGLGSGVMFGEDQGLGGDLDFMDWGS
ncbi:hypothetical protein HK097_000607 [Rhizophlyctis rosea]|uniref:Uncharacterized protein n=1 Tax=Rhizophlyctis rosea TaxID=64517 RepID=A0AAD5S5B9_9FUNG|nr:hypothetical protein HK097_000607 [Rhizophlyctis rosea]